MQRFGIKSLQWGVGLFNAFVGATMLIVPHQFGSPGYVALQSAFSLWAVLFLGSGILLVTISINPPKRHGVYVAHILAAIPLLALAYSYLTISALPPLITYTTLGFGTATAPFIFRSSIGESSGPQKEWFPVLFGFNFAIVGVVLIFFPDRFSAAGFDGIRSSRLAFGFGMLTSSVLLIAIQFVRNVPRIVVQATHLYFGAVLVLWMIGVNPALARAWTQLALYGGLGIYIALLPWTGQAIKRIGWNSLRVRFAYTFVLVTLLSLVLVTALVSAQEETDIREQSFDSQRSLTVTLQQQISDYFQLRQAALNTLAAQPDLLETALEKQQSILDTFANSRPDIVSIILYDTDGNPLAHNGNVQPAPLGLDGGKWLQALQKGDQPVEVSSSPDGKSVQFLLAAPIQGTNNRVDRFTLMTINTDRLMMMLNAISSPPDTKVYIVNERGQILVTNGSMPTAPFTNYSDQPAVAKFLAAASVTESNNTPVLGEVEYGIPREAMLASFASVSKFDWGVFIERPAATVLAKVRRVRDATVGILSLLAALTVVIGIVIANSVVAPLKALTQIVRKFATIDDGAPLPRSDIREVALLADSFDDLRTRLRVRTQERNEVEVSLLNELEERRRTELTIRRQADLLEQTSDAMFVWELETNQILSWYRGSAKLYGWSRDEVVGKTTREVLHTIPSTPWDELERILETTNQWEGELEQITRDGRKIILESRMVNVRYEDGKSTILESNRDITERKKAERRQSLLDKVSKVLAESLDYDTMLSALAQLVVPAMADWCTFSMMSDDKQYISNVLTYHSDPVKEALVTSLTQNYPVPIDSQLPSTEALRTGISNLIPDTPPEMIDLVEDEEIRKVLRELNLKSILNIPLITRGNKLGVLILNTSGDSGRVFEAADLQLAEELGRRTAAAIENARLYRQTRQERERLLVTLTSIGDAVITTDAQGTILLMNKIAESLTGWSQAEASGKQLEEVFYIVNEATRDIVESPVDKVIREGTIVGLANHTLLIAKDGTETPIDDSGAPIRDESGEIVGTVLVFRNITERKAQETVQEFLTSAYDALFSSLDHGTTLKAIARLCVPTLADACIINLVGEDGRLRTLSVTHFDPKMEQIAVDMMARVDANPDQPDLAKEVQRTGQPILITDVPPGLLESVASDPELFKLLNSFHLQSFLFVPMAVRGRILGVLSLYITEDRPHFTQENLDLAQELARRAAVAVDNARLYDQARQAQYKAEEAAKLRDEFLSVAAHELKTPVTSMRGFAQTILRQITRQGAPDTQRLQRSLQIIDDQSAKLAKLSDQLLDVSRLEAGRLILDKAPNDLVALANATVNIMRQKAGSRNLEVESPPTFIIPLDALRMEQVLVNLLDNAIKFSPEGTSIQISISPDIPDTDHVTLAVRDHGLGIPLERRDSLFNRFYQAHSEGYMGGMGLGLYISQQIVTLHGGEITPEFPEDGGMRFVITLPCNSDNKNEES
jgi:PAS domain S-box-containing protein